jgi:hypothetical protein
MDDETIVDSRKKIRLDIPVWGLAIEQRHENIMDKIPCQRAIFAKVESIFSHHRTILFILMANTPARLALILFGRMTVSFSLTHNRIEINADTHRAT